MVRLVLAVDEAILLRTRRWRCAEGWSPGYLRTLRPAQSGLDHFGSGARRAPRPEARGRGVGSEKLRAAVACSTGFALSPPVAARKTLPPGRPSAPTDRSTKRAQRPSLER
jgi:hypothetical protein